MSPYANITRDDPNRIKRFIHRRRFGDAMDLIGDGDPQVIVDYGGGDGAFCLELAARYRSSRILCYEPDPYLRAEAQRALATCANAETVDSLDKLPKGQADLVLCMEVFEHLPDQETTRSLDAIDGLLQPKGRVIIGVPVELFLPALFKGVFRMARRYGEVDATAGNVLRASLGFPLRDRPTGRLADGLPYHFHHMGFDYRRFGRRLAGQFSLRRIQGSPFAVLPPWLNSEVYFVLEKL